MSALLSPPSSPSSPSQLPAYLTDLFVNWPGVEPQKFKGVPESFILRACPPAILPVEREGQSADRGRSFITDWLHYMAGVTAAHASYHVLSGLALTAVVAPPMVGLRRGDTLWANVFTMIVGPSQDSHKTFSFRHAREVLTAVTDEFWMADSGTGPWLEDEMVEAGFDARRLLISEEGGHFLQKTDPRTNPKDITRMVMVHAADGTPIQRSTVTKVREAKAAAKNATESTARAQARKKQMNPRLSAMVAVAPSLLAAHTNLTDWTGGFMGRFLLSYGERERTFDDAIEHEQGRQRMIAHLAALSAIRNGGRCVGMTALAQRLYGAWRKTVPTVDEKLQSLVARARDTHAKRAALLSAYSRHTYEMGCAGAEAKPQQRAEVERDWEIDEWDVRFGCAMADNHIASSMRLIGSIAETEEGVWYRKIHAYVAERIEEGHRRIAEAREKGQPEPSDLVFALETKVLYQKLDVDHKKVDRWISTLVARDELCTVSPTGGSGAFVTTPAGRALLSDRVTDTSKGVDLGPVPSGQRERGYRLGLQ